jgi:hypothetical protein
MTQADPLEATVCEELDHLVDRHFKRAFLPGVGTWIALALWVAVVVTAIILRARLGGWGGVVAAILISAYVLFKIADFYERSRFAGTAETAQREVDQFCQAHGVEREEVFRIATDVKGISNPTVLQLIDTRLTEKYVEAEQRKASRAG